MSDHIRRLHVRRTVGHEVSADLGVTDDTRIRPVDIFPSQLLARCGGCDKRDADHLCMGATRRLDPNLMRVHPLHHISLRKGSSTPRDGMRRDSRNSNGSSPFSCRKESCRTSARTTRSRRTRRICLCSYHGNRDNEARNNATTYADHLCRTHRDRSFLHGSAGSFRLWWCSCARTLTSVEYQASQRTGSQPRSLAASQPRSLAAPHKHEIEVDPHWWTPVRLGESPRRGVLMTKHMPPMRRSFAPRRFGWRAPATSHMPRLPASWA